MVNLLVTFKNLPQPVRWSSIAYVSCLFGYNLIGSYMNAKNFLNKYRSGELAELKKSSQISQLHIDMIKSDWDAVKFGAKYNAFERLFDSIIWPIRLTEDIIPSIVLALNPAPKTNPGEKNN